MDPKQHILDTLDALITSLDTDQSTLGSDIITKTIDFSKSLHAIVPDPVDITQDKTHLLPDNDLLWQSGIPTLAIMHHFFEYQPHLNLKLSYAQLTEAWVIYAKKIKKFIDKTVKPGLRNILRLNKITSPFEINEMCLIWDYVVHHHRVSLMTEHLGLLDQMDWSTLTDRYVFIMQVITVGEALKGMPNSLYLHIIKVLTKILKLSESDANQRIKLIMTLRDQFAHRENPAFHNQWCDLFHGKQLSKQNERKCLESLEVLKTIYEHQHLLINYDIDIHYQDALLAVLERSEQKESPKRHQSQPMPTWLKHLIDFEQAPNNKTSKKITTLVSNEPMAYNETVFGPEPLDSNYAFLSDSATPTLKRKPTTINADILKPSIIFTSTPMLSFVFTVTALNEVQLLQNRIDLYKEQCQLHEIVRNMRQTAFANPEPLLGRESGLLKLIEIEKLLIIVIGSLLRPLVYDVPSLQSSDEATQTIKMRHCLAHKASLFKYDGNDISVLGQITLPKTS